MFGTHKKLAHELEVHRKYDLLQQTYQALNTTLCLAVHTPVSYCLKSSDSWSSFERQVLGGAVFAITRR